MDSARLWSRMSYALHLAKINLDAGLQEMRTIKDETQQSKLAYMHARSIQVLSSIYYNSGDYINTIATDEEAEKAFLHLPEDEHTKFGLAAVYNDLGASYSLINEIGKLRIRTRSVSMFEQLKDSASLLITHFNIAFIYIDMQESGKSIALFQKAMRYKNIQNDYDIKVQLFARTAAMYFRLKEIKPGKQLLDSCREFFYRI